MWPIQFRITSEIMTQFIHLSGLLGWEIRCSEACVYTRQHKSQKNRTHNVHASDSTYQDQLATELDCENLCMGSIQVQNGHIYTTSSNQIWKLAGRIRVTRKPGRHTAKSVGRKQPSASYSVVVRLEYCYSKGELIWLIVQLSAKDLQTC